ncbi:hypothetical protein LTS18_007821 [Coniosporium uncinatum]|uniref:Uncharacterized protein n=1 Tax=Coniosporium uncinatum TaxID=93489 RepID=A0ACC3DZP6_9PEZI|nr:hypothetical protein LTS18_007821 [Coniosporium uncinatum]
MSRPQSAIYPTIVHHPALPKPSNTITLLLTNLRLLDLDRRHDWPNITASSLGSRSADQKHRVKCTEWALYRLFELWDLSETRDRLAPFFPPLEPLQSLNLRAALYRCLNGLKKNGVLGREIILRKTMLDECKDEKLFDIVLSFSTAVLKKGLAGQSRRRKECPTVVRRLVLTGRLGAGERESLLPLAVAHKASLNAVLRRKEAKHAQYLRFAEELHANSEELDVRSDACRVPHEQNGKAVSNDDIVHVRKQVQENWVGNGAWVDVLLYGDETEAGGSSFKRPFHEVWSELKDGTSQQESGEFGLLRELKARVQEQRSRLQQWKGFQAELQTSREPTIRSDMSAAARNEKVAFLKFDKHQHIKIGSVRNDIEDTSASRTRPSDYNARCGAVLDMMNEELLKASSRRREPRKSDQPILSEALPTPFMSKRRTPTRTNSDRAVPASPSATLNASTSGNGRLNGSRESEYSTASDADSTSAGAEQRIESENDLLQQTSPSFTNSDTASSSPTSRRLSPTPSRPETLRTLSPSSLASSSSPTPVSATTTTTSAESHLAAQIISSLSATTPSPTKKLRPLSLAERTRMSIARTTSESSSIPQLPSALDLENSPSPTTSHSPTTSPSPSSPLSPSMKAEERQDYVQQLQTTFNRRASLLERTRQSMSLLPAPPAQAGAAAAAAESSRSKRQSVRPSQHQHQQHFPVNQFETPMARKRIASPSASTIFNDVVVVGVVEEEGEGTPGSASAAGGGRGKAKTATPTEKLFSPDAGYESVFKSRPKIAVSPPTATADAETGTGTGGVVGEGEGAVTGGTGRRSLDAVLGDGGLWDGGDGSPLEKRVRR